MKICWYVFCSTNSNSAGNILRLFSLLQILFPTLLVLLTLVRTACPLISWKSFKFKVYFNCVHLCDLENSFVKQHFRSLTAIHLVYQSLWHVRTDAAARTRGRHDYTWILSVRNWKERVVWVDRDVTSGPPHTQPQGPFLHYRTIGCATAACLTGPFVVY